MDKQTYSRKERRTRGKQLYERLAILKNSQILKDADLSNLPEDVIKTLAGHTCENKELQTRYDKCEKILGEIIRIEAELTVMREDLRKKITSHQGAHH